MTRWIVFNGYMTSDGYRFHVYVDARTEEGARRVAAPVFSYLRDKLHAPPGFDLAADFRVLSVSEAV